MQRTIRRSIRDFDLNKKVEQEKIKKIIEAANWAPSACNGQAWHFIIIDEKKILDRLIKKGLLKAKDTPVVIFVYYRKYIKQKPINEYLPDHVQSASAAIQNMLLMAASLGLGTCWINSIGAKMHRFIKAPFGYEFIAMLRLGYPKKAIKEQPRK